MMSCYVMSGQAMLRHFMSLYVRAGKRRIVEGMAGTAETGREGKIREGKRKERTSIQSVKLQVDLQL